MRLRLSFFCFVLAISAFYNVGYAQLNKAYSNPVNNADIYGYARFGIPLGKHDFGDPEVSLALQFSSDPKKEPGKFGPYWNLSLLDTHLKEINSRRLYWQAPNGMGYFLDISNEVPGRSKKPEYLHRSGNWTAKKTAKGYRITSASDPHCFYEYANGCLALFSTGKASGVYSLSYLGRDKLLSVENRKTGSAVARFNYSNDTILAEIDGEKYVFNFETADIFAPGSDKKISEFGLKALVKIVCPDGRVEAFKYSSRKNASRKVLAKDFTENLSSNIDSNKIAKAENNSWMEWSAQTGMIIADSGGQYSVGNEPFGNEKGDKKKNANHPDFVSISYRKNADEGRVPEHYFYDWKNSVKILTDPYTEETVRYSNIAAPGVSFMKLRKMEKLEGKLKDNKWKMMKSNSYDHLGRLVRAIDSNGNNRIYNYIGETDELMSAYVNGSPVYMDFINSDGLREIMSVDGKNTHRMLYFPDGAILHVSFNEGDDSEFISVEREGSISIALEQKRESKKNDQN